MCKKKKQKVKSSGSKDDFTFKIYRNRLPRARFRFLEKKKKETGTVEDDFTFNVVFHHHDLILFWKKYSTDLFLQIVGQSDPFLQKSLKLCRGDVKQDECRRCLNDSAVTITQLCPNQKEALLWLNTSKCFLKWSTTWSFYKPLDITLQLHSLNITTT